MSNSNQNWNDRNKEYVNTQKQSQDPELEEQRQAKVEGKRRI